jgi:fermentation-respiration switch protein FrsA (DUF1100 family)
MPLSLKPHVQTRILRLLIRILKTAAIVYGGSLVLLYFLQGSLIFGAMHPTGSVSIPNGAERVDCTTLNGDEIAGLFGHALLPDGAADLKWSQRPTIIYFYGTGGNVENSADQFSAFRRLGANVLVMDYVGNGMSSGSPSEAGCFATATSAYNYLCSRKDIDPSKIVVLGWSLGSAVAIDLASREPVAGLATFSAFTSMAAMGNRQYPIFPTAILRRILDHPFDSLRKIPKVQCPILIAHGRSDTFVRYSMSNQLAAAARTHVTRVSIPNVSHNDFFTAGGPVIYPALGKFLESLPSMKSPGITMIWGKNNKQVRLPHIQRKAEDAASCVL